MANVVMPGAGEKYTIRRRLFTVVGAGFDVYGPNGAPVAYCRQKAFRLKEDLRVFTGSDGEEELLRIRARSVIDFSATYDVMLPTGETIGSLRRKGLKSMLRDEWEVLDHAGNPVGKIIEDSGFFAVLRRLIEVTAVMFPQKFELELLDGGRVATYRQHFNPFVYRLGISVYREDDRVDDLMVLGAGFLLAAIEGRQG